MNLKEIKYPVRRLGFIIGWLAFFAIVLMPTPNGLEVVGQRVLAVTVLMAIFWVTEALPVSMTALMPIILFPLTGITGASGQNGIQLFAGYAHPIVYLIIGVGFLSGALVKWNLHKRIALGIVSKIGKKPSGLLLGFILATAFVSMWMSNTTAAVMMLPVALSIARILKEEQKGLKKALLLAIPFAATIGGLGTIIGSTTNPVGVGLIMEALDFEITFLGWLAIGLPFMIVLLPLFWFYFVKHFKLDKMETLDISVVRGEYDKLGPMSKGEKLTTLVFVTGVLLWVTRTEVWGHLVPFATDETISLFIAFLTMVIPVNYKEGIYLMDMKTAIKEIPWEAVMLLGGSMVMGTAFSASGVASWIAQNLGMLQGMNPLLIVIIVGVVTSIITELTSNVVVVAAFLPVLAGVGIAIGVNPLAMMIACMLSTNFAFMLPSATPPNSVVYGSGEIEIKDMIKAGFGLKLICLTVFPVVLYLITLNVLGI